MRSKTSFEVLVGTVALVLGGSAWMPPSASAAGTSHPASLARGAVLHTHRVPLARTSVSGPSPASGWSQTSAPSTVGDLSCPTTAWCLGVGPTGSVMSTSDTGANWTTISLPTAFSTLNIGGVSCPTVSQCWITGNFAGNGPAPSAIVLHSSDGGATWSSQTLPASLAHGIVTEIDCATVSVCEAFVGLTAAAGTTAPGNYAISTKDGGVTWSSAPIPVPPVNGYYSPAYSVSSLSCPTATECLAAGFSGMFSTTNGGASWSPFTNLPTTVTAESYVDNFHSVSCATATDCVATGPSVIFSTSDAGGTWTADKLPLSALSGQLEGVQCPTASTCWARSSGYYPGAPGSPPGGLILTTTDGGTTWSPVGLPAGFDSYGSAALACPSASVCYVGGFGSIVVTSDAGATWSVTQPPGFQGALHSLSCPSTQVCFGIEGQEVAKSADGGVTWTALSFLPNMNYVQADLSSISCPTTSQCWVAGYGYNNGVVILNTNDAGATWTQQAPSGIYGTLGSIDCTSTTHCVAGGVVPTHGDVINPVFNGGVVPPPNQSLFMSTSDGGTTWTVDSAGTVQAAIDSISCASTTHCVASGNPSPIVQTCDYCSGSSSTCTASGCTVTSVVACIAGTCTINGQPYIPPPPQPPTIAVTDDGGSTWTPVSLVPANVDLVGFTAVACPSAQRCWAIGEVSEPGTDLNGNGIRDAVMLTSTNGGTSWFQQALPGGLTGAQLGGLSCPTPSTCFAVGQLVSRGPVFGTRLETAPFAVAVATTDAGRSWNVQPLPDPAHSSLGSIACPSATDCVASGPFVDPVSNGNITYGPGGYAGSGVPAYPSGYYGYTQAPIVTTTVGGAPPSASGYWLAGTDGGVFAFGDAGYYGSLGGMTLQAPIVAITATPDGKGYWLAAADGGVFVFGDAPFLGSPVGRLTSPDSVVGMAATPDGNGYWIAGSDGSIYAMGDAMGVVGNEPSPLPGASPIVGIASGGLGGAGGLWLLGADGTVYPLGGAPSHGSASFSLSSIPLRDVAIVPTADGGGYWLANISGSIAALGNAPFLGSPGGADDFPLLTSSMAATPTGSGYWATDFAGNVAGFGDAPFLGSLAGVSLGGSIVGMAPSCEGCHAHAVP